MIINMVELYDALVDQTKELDENTYSSPNQW
jgi:hypothetical protein